MGRWAEAHPTYYDHAYKLIASLPGRLSAFVGNVVRKGQPWSQIAPSAIGLLTILFLFLFGGAASYWRAWWRRTDPGGPFDLRSSKKAGLSPPDMPRIRNRQSASRSGVTSLHGPWPRSRTLPL